jgi:hypothetical protein
MTVVIFVIALGFLMALAGGPGPLMRAIENTLEAGAAMLFDAYQNFRA